jgi:glycosyltransferase involved in cell wall biosynthesis
MVAIESMACGVPVIAVDEWGYRESVLAGETGYLIDPIGLEENLIKTIQGTDRDIFQDMKSACRKRALDFDTENMLSEIKKYIS